MKKTANQSIAQSTNDDLGTTKVLLQLGERLTFHQNDDKIVEIRIDGKLYLKVSKKVFKDLFLRDVK